jgi:N4-gp56 family major capsid protein
MTLNSAIPQLWSAKIYENLNDIHVYADLLTSDFTGELKGHGSSVRIQTVGRVTINSYTKNTGITRQNLTNNDVVLVLDQQNYFDFEIDDIDTVQQMPKLFSAYTREAAWGLSDTADADIAAVITAGVATANVLTAATSVGTGAADDDAYELLVDLGVKLTENNVPEAGRWCVIPPWFEGVLRKDPRFVSFGTSENRSTLTNGRIGTAAGFDLRVSNNVPVSGSDYDILAGVSSAGGFVMQMDKVVPYSPEDAFSDALKGLQVYGRKIFDPNRLAKVVATAA